MTETWIRGAWLRGREGVSDLLLRDGRIAVGGSTEPASAGAQRIDAAGYLALPGLVDGHAHLDKMLWGTREAFRDAFDVQIVAFSQAGAMLRPGALDLLEQAVREGAAVLGGLDSMGIDHDPKEQLDGPFAIAGRQGCALDIHLHDAGVLGAATFEMIIERTRALGLRDKGR